MFYSPFIWSQWGDGHGSIGLLQARFLAGCPSNCSSYNHVLFLSRLLFALGSYLRQVWLKCKLSICDFISPCLVLVSGNSQYIIIPKVADKANRAQRKFFGIMRWKILCTLNIVYQNKVLLNLVVWFNSCCFFLDRHFYYAQLDIFVWVAHQGVFQWTVLCSRDSF